VSIASITGKYRERNIMARLLRIRALALTMGIVATLFSFTAGPLPRAAAQRGSVPSYGQDFFFTFSSLVSQNVVGETWDEQQIYLYINSAVNTSGLIDFTDPAITDIPFTVTANTATSVELPGISNEPHPHGAPVGISQRSIRVTADADIWLHALSYSTGEMTDGALVPPTAAGGTMFLVPSYASPESYAQYDLNHAGFLVIAHEDNTQINYLPRSSEPFPSDGTYDGVTLQEIHYSDPPVYDGIETVTLDEGEVFHYQVDSTDPSGSIIESDKPITVYSYSSCATIPSESGPCDYLFESVIPVAAWGPAYLIPTNVFGVTSDTFRAYAWEDNTVITANASNQFATLDAGEYVEYRQQANISLFLSANKPFMLVRYLNSANWASPPSGDAAMLTMIPADAGLPVTYLYTADHEVFTGVITVIRPRDAAVSKSDGLTVDLGWQQFTDAAFDFNNMPALPGGIGFISSEPLQVYATGIRIDEAYHYPSGMNLAPFWQPTSLLDEHLPTEDEAGRVLPECRDATDIAVSPQFIDLAPGGSATMTVTLRNTGSVPAGSHDVLLSLSDGLSVVGSSNDVVNLGQRAALQNVILEPNETRSFEVTVQAAATLPTAPLHVTELYCQARVVERIDGVFLTLQPAVAEQPTAAAPVEQPTAAPAVPAPLPAVLPNTVGERGETWSVLLPAAVLANLVLVLSLMLHRQRRRQR
jgi:hypothetical protein